MWRRGLTRALAHRSALTSGVAMSTVPGLPTVAAPRAAVCVIGNEVLTGKVLLEAILYPISVVG